MSKLGSLYIQLGEPDGELAGCCETAEWAAGYIETLRRQLAAATDQISAAIAACKVKDEALRDCAFDESGYCINPDAEEALAVTASISEWKTNDELRKQLAELLDWQQKAFAAHPNIDMDIDRLA